MATPCGQYIWPLLQNKIQGIQDYEKRRIMCLNLQEYNHYFINLSIEQFVNSLLNRIYFVLTWNPVMQFNSLEYVNDKKIKAKLMHLPTTWIFGSSHMD